MTTCQNCVEQKALLREISYWIGGWNPNFTDDNEWPEVAERLRVATATTPEERGEVALFPAEVHPA